MTQSGRVTGKEWWFPKMCPDTVPRIEPITDGLLAFWLWPSFLVTALFMLPLALMGASIMWVMMVLPPLAYLLANSRYWLTMRQINKRPSRWVRVKPWCMKPRDSKLRCVSINGSFELYLRFPSAIDADLYAIEFPSHIARTPQESLHPDE